MSTLLSELIKKKLVTSEQLLAVRKKCSVTRKPIQDLLIDTGYVKEDDLFNAAKSVFAGSVVDLDYSNIDPSLVKLIPLEKAKYYGIFPIEQRNGMLIMAMSDPSDVMVWDEIHFMTNLRVKPVLCKKSQISKYINKFYADVDTVHAILKDTMDDSHVQLMHDERAHEELIDLAHMNVDNSSFVKLVNKIICDAVEARASDIHIEPHGKVVEIRYRIDGSLKSIIKIPRDLHKRVAARIKILAKMDIAEHRKVQEGRVKIMIDGKKIDLRISIIPVFHGEKIVLRILDTRNSQFDLNKIGFPPDDLEIFKSAIQKPQGVILVTGPTGAGKTTTLYAALQHIKCETKNIVTIEDPIEYLIDGINQLQLNRFKDVTFANGLRSILRQDPDVILVGEVRDLETAEIAFRASLTGHLVFSTLHTNNAASSITRLLDLGLESYLIASSINLFVAQRLVRLICPNCCREDFPDEELLIKFKDQLENKKIKRFYTGKGCAHCNFSGFYGRTSIFEILKVDDKIKALIYNKASEAEILREAINDGMRTLTESGIMKVAAGLTTLKEIAKVIDVAAGKEGTPIST